MARLSDQSLGYRQPAASRSIGELAWHIVTSQREIAGKVRLQYDAPTHAVPPPPRAAQIHSAYVDAASALAEAVERQWTDEMLELEDEADSQQWPRGVALGILLRHEIHHRGQLTVLMRQAGLTVPGVYRFSSAPTGETDG